MPTTRSKAKQSHIEDFTDEKPKYSPLPSGDKRIFSRPAKASKATSTGAPRKRPEPVKSEKRKKPETVPDEDSKSPDGKAKKARSNSDAKTKSKALPKNGTKQSHFETGDVSTLQEPIIINRSPVLQLWGATVSSFLHPDLSWPTCLSIGNAISALCAVSKGKSIGVIEPKDEDPDERQKRKEAEKKKWKEEGVKEVQVMGFSLRVKGEAVLLGGKGKPLNEEALKGKFGGVEMYEAARRTMRDALETWKCEEEELNKKAFHMYEQFRPSVAAGRQGWGRKGELNLMEVENVIRNRENY
jgi:hypothetical protein